MTMLNDDANVHMRSPNVDTQQNRTWQLKINICEQAIEDMNLQLSICLSG